MNILKDFVLIHQRDFKDTLIYTVDGKQHKANRSAIQWLEHFCLYGGSTLEGRIQAMRTLTTYRQKLPVYVSNGYIYFPLYGHQCKQNYWLCYNYITSVNFTAEGVVVSFSEKFSYDFNVDRRIIRKQMQRCSEYLHLIQKLNRTV